MPIFPFFTFAVWPPHASSLPKFRLPFKVRELCSSLGVVTHSFCLTNICSKPRAKSWNAFFSSSTFGSHDRSFDPSVVDEQHVPFLPVLVMGTLSIGLFDFSVLASFGVSFSCLVIFALALDGSANLAGPFDSSNFSFPSLIRLWTLRLSALQFFME